MSKLRNLLLIALVLAPAATLNASPVPSATVRPALGGPQPVALMCWIYQNGRWWYIPC
jgi:hypothetical protein